jgi:hypothetical protein
MCEGGGGLNLLPNVKAEIFTPALSNSVRGEWGVLKNRDRQISRKRGGSILGRKA